MVPKNLLHCIAPNDFKMHNGIKNGYVYTAGCFLSTQTRVPYQVWHRHILSTEDKKANKPKLGLSVFFWPTRIGPQFNQLHVYAWPNVCSKCGEGKELCVCFVCVCVLALREGLFIPPGPW